MLDLVVMYASCYSWDKGLSQDIHNKWKSVQCHNKDSCANLCVHAYVFSRCVSLTKEHRLDRGHTVTRLIKRESLHRSGYQHHHCQTFLIMFFKCCFIQAISPLLFAYANMTELIISFYISHAVIVIIKTSALS